ncbi:uncharacterized protein [Anabrus simplex]|uniref:uncharacterized protein n=1 Tax=Anabrus simplex TaxID=316456 RepID=UPI0035A39467
MARLWLSLLLLFQASVVRAFGGDTIVFEDDDIDDVSNYDLISKYFTSQERKCFEEEKFFYEPDKQCYALLTTGPCGCNADGDKSPGCEDGRGRWLVLEWQPSDRLQAVCRQCPCCDKPLNIYMATDQKCHHRVKELSRLCPHNGTELRHNEFGEGECDCMRSPPHAKLLGKTSGVCYPLYHRGPCRSGETLLPTRDPITLELVGHCAPDPCAHKGEGFARWEIGDRKCYQLGSQGPCNNQSKFNVQRTSRIPDCIQSTHAIVNPKEFKTGFPPPANLPTVDKNFALDLISGRRKRRAGKH